MYESMLIEYTLSVIFDYLKKQLLTSPKDRSPFDFAYKDERGKNIAIEVKGSKLNKHMLNSLLKRLKQSKEKIDAFFLITPKRNFSKTPWHVLKK